MSVPRSVDVVIAGAGIVGCCTAHAMARAGLHVALIDKGAIGGGVSGASLSCVGTHMVSTEEMAVLQRGASLWAEAENRLGRDIEYHRGGQLRFVAREADRPIAESWVAAERAHGCRVELLEPDDVRRIVPALEGAIVCATWSPDDATVNPFLACRAHAAAAATAGAHVLPHTAVTGLRCSDDRVTGVETDAGTIACSWVVNAAGSWARRIASMAGLDVPIRPRKAQCLATVALPPTIPCVVGACESAGGVEAGYTQIQQARSGQVLFNTVPGGGERPEGTQDIDHAVDHAFVIDSVRTLLWLFPGLATADLLRSWARYEAVTPDERFLIGPVPGCDGLLMAAGDSGTGFTRAPVIAEMLTAHATHDASPLPLDPYRPDRFAGLREAG